MLFSGPNIFLFAVALLSTIANSVILVTLKTTKQFSRSVKFHLGMIALNEILAVWLNLARRIMYVVHSNSKRYETMSIALCKVGLLVGVLCTTSSVLTNISMNVESLQMLQVSTHNKGCFQSNKWRLTSRGKKLLAIFVLIGCTPIIIGTVTAADTSQQDFRCDFYYERVFNQDVLKYVAVQCVIMVLANIFLMTMTVIKLNRVYVKSNAISKRTQASTRHTKRRTHALGTFRNLRVDSNGIQPIRTETLSQHISRTHVQVEPHQSSPQHEQEQQLEKHSRPDDDDDVTIEQPAEGSQQQEQVPRSTAVTVVTVSGVPSPATDRTPPDGNNTPSVTPRQRQLLLLMVTATAFFTICYTPYILTLLLYVTCSEQCGVTRAVTGIAALPIFCYALFNIAIYIAKNKDFRNSLRSRLFR